MQGYCNSESRWRTGPWVARAQPPGTSWCGLATKITAKTKAEAKKNLFKPAMVIVNEV